MKAGLYFREITIIAILVIVASVLSCCTKGNSPPEIQLPDVVSFKNDLIPIFTTNCAISGCHISPGAKAGMNLTAATAYNQLYAKHEIDTITPTNSMLYIRMNSISSPMPPSGKLSNYDVSLVLKWIQQKAKNN